MLKVSDGDTFDCVIDRGFKETKEVRVRLFGINAFEKSGRLYSSFQKYCDRHGIILPNKTERKRLGILAHKQLTDRLNASQQIILKSEKLDSFGRVLATVFADGQDINQWLIEQGVAIAYS